MKICKPHEGSNFSKGKCFVKQISNPLRTQEHFQVSQNLLLVTELWQ